MLSGLDTAWVTNTNNGLHAHGHPSWRNVQLETAKLLELGCVLPATILPHFQMYRWAFVGSQHDYCSSDIVNSSEHDSLPLSKFIPHVTRIAQLMDFRYTSHSPVSFIKSFCQIDIISSTNVSRQITARWRDHTWFSPVSRSTTFKTFTVFSRPYAFVGRTHTISMPTQKKTSRTSWQRLSKFCHLTSSKKCQRLQDENLVY